MAVAKQLITDFRPVKFSLEENKSGRLVAKGLFAVCGVPTENGRVYTQVLYEREISKLKKVMKARRGYGELDHPQDGITKLSRVSHIITNLKVESDGSVIGEAEILDTPAGKTLRALIEAGCEVGVSSRGVGSTRRKDDGTEEVNEDFRLKTFDFVAEPAAADAFPEIFAESVEADWDADMLRSEFPELLVDIRSSILAEATGDSRFTGAVEAEVSKREAVMREDTERRLRDEVAKIKDSVQQEFQESVSADPKEQRASAMLAHVVGLLSGYSEEGDESVVRDALMAKDLEVKESKEEADKLFSYAQGVTNQVLIERMVGGLKNADAIRSLFLEPGEYEPDDLQRRLEEAIKNFGHDKIDPLEETTEQDYLDQMEQYEGMISELRSDKKKLKRGLQEAIKTRNAASKEADTLGGELDEAIERLEEADSQLESAGRKVSNARASARRSRLTAYKERVITPNTNSPELRSMLESADSEEGIDEMVAAHGRRRMSDPQMERVRSKIKRGRRQPMKTLQEDEDEPHGDRFHDEELALLGESMSNLRILSGMKPVE